MENPNPDQSFFVRQTSPFQVELLYKQLIHASIASFIAAIFITIVLWSVASHQWLIVWFSLICLVTVARIFLVHRFRLKSQEKQILKFWQSASLLLIFLGGIAWGSLAFIFDFNWPAFHQFAIISVLFILALGSISAYATIPPAYITSISVMLLPLSGLFIFSGGDDFVLYGIGLVFLWGLLLSISKRYYDSVILEIGKVQHVHEQLNDLKTSHEDLGLAFEEKQSEEMIARAVYTRIAKLQPIDKYGIKGIVEPMGNFSGDFIFYALTPDGHIYVLFADFTGHGLPAALGAIPVSSAFYSMTAKGLPPEEILQEINKNLFAQLSTEHFCCASFIVLNPERTKMEIWNGGIPDILIIKEHDQPINHISSTNLPLGIQVNEDEYTFESIELAKGDVVFAYTDGVTESWNKSDEPFGVQRLEEHLLENFQKPDFLDIIKAKVDKHSEGRIQEDDISMLEIRC